MRRCSGPHHLSGWTCPVDVTDDDENVRIVTKCTTKCTLSGRWNRRCDGWVDGRWSCRWNTAARCCRSAFGHRSAEGVGRERRRELHRVGLPRQLRLPGPGPPGRRDRGREPTAASARSGWRTCSWRCRRRAPTRSGPTPPPGPKRPSTSAASWVTAASRSRSSTVAPASTPRLLPALPAPTDPSRLYHESGLGIPLMQLFTDRTEISSSPLGTACPPRALRRCRVAPEPSRRGLRSRLAPLDARRPAAAAACGPGALTLSPCGPIRCLRWQAAS